MRDRNRVRKRCFRLAGPKGLAWALVWTVSTVVPPGLTQAATPLETVRLSPDITAELGTEIVDDEDVAADDLSGTVVLLGVGTIPQQTNLDAYHLLSNGDQLLSFDTTVQLPGVTAKPGDVVRFDGVTFTIEFNARANGVPDDANVDAVTLFGDLLLLSLDVTVSLGGQTFDDEDLVLFDGVTFSLFFDGSAAGIGSDLALDAVHYVDCNDHLLLSFDGSGTVGPVVFDDDDLLEHDRIATWEMAYEGSVQHAAWDSADLDAVHATVDLGPPMVFGQTITASANKEDFEWPNPVAFEAVRGSFVSSANIGSYAVNLTASGNGTLFSDPTSPASGTGYWYLMKPGGCLLSSWQTTLGAEPGRDAALP